MNTKGRVFAELETIKKSGRGVVSPQAVVRFARNPKTALHSQFEWNNGKAAERWRLHQARNLLRVYVTVIEGCDDPVRVWTSLPADRTKDGGYRATVDVLSNAAHREQLKAMAMRDMQIFQAKYRGIEELAGVFAAMDKVQMRKRKSA